MPKQIKVTDELYEELKRMAGGRPIPKLLRSLISGGELLEQLDRKAEFSRTGIVTPTPEELEDLKRDRLPLCCVEYLEDNNKPCKHWAVKPFQEFGNYYNKVYNILTGKTKEEYEEKGGWDWRESKSDDIMYCPRCDHTNTPDDMCPHVMETEYGFYFNQKCLKKKELTKEDQKRIDEERKKHQAKLDAILKKRRK